jgi:hypothetical protein
MFFQCYAVLNVQSQRWDKPLEDWSAKQIRQELGRLIIGLHPQNITRVLQKATARDQAAVVQTQTPAYDNWDQQMTSRGKKDLRRLRSRRVRHRRDANDIGNEATKEADETALDYILLFASYFPQLRSTQVGSIFYFYNDL